MFLLTELQDIEVRYPDGEWEPLVFDNKPLTLQFRSTLIQVRFLNDNNRVREAMTIFARVDKGKL